MRKNPDIHAQWAAVIGALCLLFIGVLPVSAQEAALGDSVSVDTLAIPSADLLNADPEWYVAPVIPVSLRAPKRATAAAASCNVDSILTFNIDSVLTEITAYAYDEAGRTTYTTVWTCNSDGSRVGKSRNEYGYTGSTQTMTAVYTWDNTLNDWIGAEKHEYTYAGGRMTSSTLSVWLNGAWMADKRYTYKYDAAGRQIEYFEYNRNTKTNALQPVKGWEQAWFSDEILTLDAKYTSFTNGAWNGGTKKEWKYNADTVVTMYAYYGSIANGKWVGSSKEEWEYTNDTLTMHADYGWANGDWAGSQKEEWTYDNSGRQTLYRKYGWAVSDWALSLKEENEYEGANLIRIENYSYANGVAIGERKENWSFTNGMQTLHQVYTWVSQAWTLSLKEENEFEGENLIRLENYSYANGVATGIKKEQTTYISGKKTEFVTFVWSNGTWVNATKETWDFTDNKQTLHEKFVDEGAGWSKTLKEETEYSGNNIVRVENYSYANGVTTGIKKEQTTYISGKKTEFVTFVWSNGIWLNATKETWGFTDNKQTLYEKFVDEGAGWSKTLKEETEYSGNNIVRVESYSYVNGVETGVKKETYTYEGAKKTQAIVYQWYNNKWENNTKENWTFTNNKQTLHEMFGWNGLEWITTLREAADFDAIGNQTLVEIYLYQNGVLGGTKKEEYTYTSGTKTSTVVYAWINGAWVYSTRNEAGYQNGNTQVSEANYTWDGTSWQGKGTRTMTTTENRLITELLTQNWPSGATEWTNATVTRNTYNAEGVNIMTYNGTWNGSRWAVSSMTRIEKIMDTENHQLLYATWRCGADSIWRGLQKDTAAYSATGKLIFSASYTAWANNDWVPSYKIEIVYDEADRVLTQQRLNWISGKWVGNSRSEYEYDKSGNVTSSAIYSGWSTKYANWVGRDKTETVYNEAGQVTELINYLWGTNDWEPFQKYNYVRDAQNRVIEQVLQSYSNGTWVNSSKNEKEYLGNTLIKDNTYSWVKGEWSIRTRKEWYYDTEGQVKLRREIEGKWTSKGLTSYSEKYYTYSCDALIIRFVNYDGTVLETQTLDKGITPVYTGETPVKPADVDNSYIFYGWTPEIVPVTGNATYTATFTASKNTYTVTWVDDAGNEIDRTTVEYGVMPTHADAIKTNTAEYTYTFTGWTPGIGIVTGDATYQATFTATKNNYTIKFLNYNGEVLLSTDIEYGKMPEYTGVIPTKPADDQYRYAFAGWDKEIAEVVGEETYTATFAPTSNEYTISWFNDDNTLIDQTTVAYGVVPTHADATKENTAEFTYTFSGWDHEPVAVVGNASYTATFTATKNSYTVTWLNEDGSEIESQTLEYGATPAHVDIYKESTAEYTYTFTGWIPGIGIVTGDAEYTATFTQTKNKYLVTFVDEDGTVFQSSEVEYGAIPTAPSDPTKANTAEWSYTFAGWTPAVATVTGDATYTATFTATERVENKTFTITFYYEDGVTVLDQVTVKYGETPSTSLIPSKYSEEHYYYSFAGWSPEIVPATGDASYTATYRAIPQQYTVTFKNYNGRILLTTNAPYGEIPVYAGETPAKPKDKQYTYTFSGWSPELTEVTGPATYTAVFEGILNQYTVLFLDEDGTELDRQAVDYGAMPVYAGETPQKEEDEQYRYTFKDWSPKLTKVTKDATYRATYTSRSKTEGLGDVQRDDVRCTKVLIDGQIYILRGDKTYTLQGMEVR